MLIFVCKRKPTHNNICAHTKRQLLPQFHKHKTQTLTFVLERISNSVKVIYSRKKSNTNEQRSCLNETLMHKHK